MNLTVIAAELFAAGVLPPGELEITKLEGGTSSQVYIMYCGKSTRLALKFNDQETIASEAAFLKRYDRIELLPQLRYADPENRYLVYEYIEGSTAYTPGRKPDMLAILAARVISQYDKTIWPGERHETWQQALVQITEDFRRESGMLFTAAEHRLIANLAEHPNRVTGAFCHLHGDLVVHNFIFRGGQLAGVIDPIPMIGQPVYDLAFAFCSSPDDLAPEIIAGAVKMKEWPFTRDLNVIYEDVLIALYNRMVACTLHHPRDLNAYIAAWRQWKSIVAK